MTRTNQDDATTSNPPAASNATTANPTSDQPLPVLPLTDGVILPDMVVTVSIQSTEANAALDAATAGRLLLLPRRSPTDNTEARYARIGVVATIEDRGTLPDGTPAITVRSHQRARVGAGVVGTGNALWVEVEELEAPGPDTDRTAELTSEYRAAAQLLLAKVGGRRMASVLDDLTDPGALADSVGHWPDLSFSQRLQLLETTDTNERLAMATTWVKQALAEVEAASRIQKEVSEDLEKDQREAILRRQMAAIQAELSGDEADDISRYRAKLAKASLATETETAIQKEIDRLERTGNDSMESNWIRTWLDTVFDLPWNERSSDPGDLVEARAILDADHTGLDDVKERLIEFMAVRKLRAERGVIIDGDRRKGVILALVGPPGVGKTSLGASVARALDRPFARLALGGVRDEAEIRGHRRTYVGARPGRLVRALSEAGSMNPVIVLDEVDKLGNGWQGDPSAALLEVLDPAQNHSFRDNYLEFDLDLSDVVFVATANALDTIPAPLLDRMEVITVDGYTEREKAAIATTHLLPQLIESNGLTPTEIEVPAEVIHQIAADYTQEAGVRRLERLLDKIVRKSAASIATEPSPCDTNPVVPMVITPEDLPKLLGRAQQPEPLPDRVDRPGVAAGLAVTGAGGDVLFVETALVEGTGEPLLTGQLGEVMKESAAIAQSLIASLTDDYNFALPTGRRLHVHFPAGAIPKDGPSAGITMTTALVSLLTGRLVRNDLAMTGEVTLGGRVLPIGGVKQKVLAAHRAGVRTVLLPIANGPDLEDVPADVLEHLTIHLVSDIGEVLGHALTPVSAT